MSYQQPNSILEEFNQAIAQLQTPEYPVGILARSHVYLLIKSHFSDRPKQNKVGGLNDFLARYPGIPIKECKNLPDDCRYYYSREAMERDAKLYM